MAPSGEAEAAEISEIEDASDWGSSDGVAYLVASEWWKSWEEYSGHNRGDGTEGAAPSGPRPGPIDNSSLLPSGAAAGSSPTSPDTCPLRPWLKEGQDFHIVSEEGWKKLHGWYGGGPAIARPIDTKRYRRVLLYPLRLEVAVKDPNNGKEQSVTLSVPHQTSLTGIKARACKLLHIAQPESVTLWDYTGGRKVRCLERPADGEEDEDQGGTVAGGSAAQSGPGGSRTQPPPPAPPLPPWSKGGGKDGGVEQDGAGEGDAKDAMAVDGPPGSTPEAAQGDAAEGVAAMETDGPAGAGAAEGGQAESAAAAAAGGGGGGGGNEYMDNTTAAALGLIDKQLLRLRRQDESDSDSEEACGSDNDTAAGTARRRGAAAAAARSRSAGGSDQGLADKTRRGAKDAGQRTVNAAPAANGLGRQRGPANVLTFGSDAMTLRDGQAPGLAGLSNLGNTCFMNSSLQCLAHTVPLMAAFLGGAYLADLNRTNPLGMQGELAEAFGQLMMQLWRGGVSSVTPRQFKAKIGRFAPQFSGYQQHDSQEFLAFLLDGLHEDTNRIKNKPYVEEKDQPGRSDDELAAEAWANYRARNDSLVVDHFQGLFKSTVDCPQCSFNSVKFDPFMYLSLPLPESRLRTVHVVLCRTDGAAMPCRMALELPSGAAVSELLRATAAAAELPAEVLAAPESHLLAARPLRTSANVGGDEVVLFSDPRVRVADALDAGGHGGGFGSPYSLRSGAGAGEPPSLVVYYYPDASCGPKALGCAPVIVHFKRHNPKLTWSKGVWCGAPLVLYMPEDRPPYDPAYVVRPAPASGGLSSSSSGRTEYELKLYPECPLVAALLRTLQPIQKGPVVLQPPESVTAAAAADGDMAAPPAGPGQGEDLGQAQGEAADGAMVEEEGSGQQQGVVVVGREGEAAVVGGLAGGRADAVVGAAGIRRQGSGGGGSGELMTGLGDLFQEGGDRGAAGKGAGGDPEAEAEAEVAAMEEAVAPSELPAVIMAGPPGPTSDAFDMWAAQADAAAPQQQQDAGATTPAAGEAAAGAPAGPPFTIRLCTNKGESALWGSDPDEINKDSHREFLLSFSEACIANNAAAPYHPEALDAPLEHATLTEHRRRAAAGPQPVSLDDCMRTFLQPERLAESDAWYCPRCKAHVCADKKLDLWSLPEVLVVHLKRFSYTRYSRNKLDTRVDFPLQGLDLTPYVLHTQSVQPMYDLYAVSNHYGSLGGGHYTAYARIPGETGGWHCFDDSHVSPVSDMEALRSPAAYVLFYRRRREGDADPRVCGQLLADLEGQRAAAVEALRQTDPEAAAAVAGPAAGGDAGRRQDQALAADASHRSGGGTAAGPEAALDGDGEDTPLFGHRRSAAAGNDDAAAAEETADFMGFSTHGSAGGSALGALARGDAGRPCSPANSDGDAAARRGGGGGRKGRGGGGNASDGEDASLQVQGRSMDAFTSLEAVGRPKWLDRFRVDDEDDLYGTGSAVDSMPARVYGNYIHIGGGPPTPDAPGSPDLNNADVTDAYDEAAVLDVIRATGSDVGSMHGTEDAEEVAARDLDLDLHLDDHMREAAAGAEAGTGAGTAAAGAAAGSAGDVDMGDGRRPPGAVEAG